MKTTHKQMSPSFTPNCHYLQKQHPESGHDIGGVLAAQSPDHADGSLPDLKGLVMQSEEESVQVLRLRQVRVEPLVQTHQHAEANVWVCNT